MLTSPTDEDIIECYQRRMHQNPVFASTWLDDELLHLFNNVKPWIKIDLDMDSPVHELSRSGFEDFAQSIHSHHPNCLFVDWTDSTIDKESSEQLSVVFINVIVQFVCCLRLLQTFLFIYCFSRPHVCLKLHLFRVFNESFINNLVRDLNEL